MDHKDQELPLTKNYHPYLCAESALLEHQFACAKYLQPHRHQDKPLPKVVQDQIHIHHQIASELTTPTRE